MNSFGNVSVFQHMNDNGILEMVITMDRNLWKKILSLKKKLSNFEKLRLLNDKIGAFVNSSINNGSFAKLLSFFLSVSFSGHRKFERVE